MAPSSKYVALGISFVHVLTSVAAWFLIDFALHDLKDEKHYCGMTTNTIYNATNIIVICGFFEASTFLYVTFPALFKDHDPSLFEIFRGSVFLNLFIQFFAIGFYSTYIFAHARCITSHSLMKSLSLLTILIFSLWSWFFVVSFLSSWICCRRSPSSTQREPGDENLTAAQASYSISYFSLADPETLTTPLTINEVSPSAPPMPMRGYSDDQTFITATSYIV
jgi:hypothetical protein